MLLRSCYLLVVMAFFALSVYCSEVIELYKSNFEKITQTSSGHTTGDWLVKFYAPWCEHSLTMVPVIEQVAEELKGSVSVARVDIMQNRDLGTRFTIVGFPTLLLFSQGHVFTFKGRRSVEEIVEFARGGFQLHEAEIAPKELGLFAEFEIVTRHAYKEATKDLLAGNFYTRNVFCMAMPIIFGFILLIVIFVPCRKMEVPLNSRDYQEPENSPLQIPISSRARPPTSTTDSSTKNTKTNKQE